MHLGVDSFVSAVTDPGSGRVVGPAERMEHLLEEITLADRVGLYSFGIGEHHRSEYYDSAPEVILGAAVVDDARLVPLSGGDDLRGVGRLDEPGLAEVRRVDAEDEASGPVLQHGLEVRGPRPIRRPDLDEPRAGPPDDLRDPDAAADLDELTA